MERELIDQILTEWLWRIDDPRYPTVEDPVHLYHLKEALLELELSEEFISEFIGNLTETGDPEVPPELKLEVDNDGADDDGPDLDPINTEFPDDVGERDKISVDDKIYRKDMLSPNELLKIKKAKKNASEK